ncbi:hypothetical protein EDD22DRAFT_19619 [Suillus occidentalis]|nr:hypothetical protein EDD22DRAFT_19619 [Suillus occidentalis]
MRNGYMVWLSSLELIFSSPPLLTKPFDCGIFSRGNKLGSPCWVMTKGVWTVAASFESIGQPLEHPDAVCCVAFFDDGQLVASGCDDALLRVWTVPQSDSDKESKQDDRRRPRPSIPIEIIPRSESRSVRTGIPRGFFDDFSPHVQSNLCVVTEYMSRLKELILPADPRMGVHRTPYGTHASRTSSTASRFTGNCNKHKTRRGVHATGTNSRDFCDRAFPSVDLAKSHRRLKSQLDVDLL